MPSTDLLGGARCGMFSLKWRTKSEMDQGRSWSGVPHDRTWFGREGGLNDEVLEGHDQIWGRRWTGGFIGAHQRGRQRKRQDNSRSLLAEGCRRAVVDRKNSPGFGDDFRLRQRESAPLFPNMVLFTRRGGISQRGILTATATLSLGSPDAGAFAFGVSAIRLGIAAASPTTAAAFGAASDTQTE